MYNNNVYIHHSINSLISVDISLNNINLYTETEMSNEEKNEKIWRQFKPTQQQHEDEDKKHYELAEYISKHIFKHYPEYQLPLLTKYLTKDNTNKHYTKDMKQHMYDGMVMELQRPNNNFNILITDSYSHTKYNGQSYTSEQYPSLYQCSKGKCNHFCL